MIIIKGSKCCIKRQKLILEDTAAPFWKKDKRLKGNWKDDAEWGSVVSATDGE